METLRACSCCGLVQGIPTVPPRHRAVCARCGTRLPRRVPAASSQSRTAALALAALILYPFAVSLPMLEVEQLGHSNESSILEGVVTLLSKGQLGVGIVVLLCSVVFPLGKLLALLWLTGGRLLAARRHTAMVYRLVEWTGRWGMLDVLLVAILVAALKLGDVMQVTPGPGAMAFTLCVVLSLLAAASFDPRRVWETIR